MSGNEENIQNVGPCQPPFHSASQALSGSWVGLLLKLGVTKGVVLWIVKNYFIMTIICITN